MRLSWTSVVTLVRTTLRKLPLWLLGLGAIAAPIASFIYVNQTPERIEALVKVGAVFLAWPYVTVVLVLSFLLLFRDPLSTAIGRVQRLKGLGGEVELQVQAPPKPDVSVDAAREERAEKIEAQVAAQVTPEAPPQLPQELEDIFTFLGEPVPHVTTMREAGEFAGRMLARATFAKEEAQRWKFYYLSFFLVPNSKLVLRWFEQRRFARREDYENDWRVSMPDPVARAIVLIVLASHGLLEEVNGTISVTREGHALLAFLESNNAWHQPAIAPGDRNVFYAPMIPPAPRE